MLQRVYLIFSLLLAVSIVLSRPALANAYLGISPTQINLTPSNKTGIVTVLNKGESAVNIQVSAKSWDMDENGKFIETDSNEFIFYPKTLSIEAHEQALIRVGYMSDLPDIEKPYRLFIEEVPAITQPDEKNKKVNIGLTSILRLSMPLYVIPVNNIPVPDIELAALKAEDNVLRVGVKNPTGYHITLKKVTVKLLKADKVLAEKTVELKLQRILGKHRIFVNMPMAAKKLCQQADALQVEMVVDNMKEPYQSKVALKADCQL